MKPTHPFRGLSAFRAQRAFTLIEMLVVIAIIGILAGLIVPLAGLAAKKKILARARIEIDTLDLAISTYKNKKGFYPPDNATAPAGAFTNQLFYELWGVVQQTPRQADQIFTNTFNANEIIKASTLTKFFGNGTTPVGINNSSPDINEIYNFVPTLKADKIQNINTVTDPVWVFALPSPGPTNSLPVAPVPGSTPVNVIRYVSSNPTNNPNTFDLWVDVIIGGKTNRISNWNKDSEIVY